MWLFGMNVACMVYVLLSKTTYRDALVLGVPNHTLHTAHHRLGTSLETLAMPQIHRSVCSSPRAMWADYLFVED